MITLYTFITRHAEHLFNALLQKRLGKGKEDPVRLNERRGVSVIERPAGTLIWLHGASVGESQSALILVNTLLVQYPALNVLVTTGTQSSAQMMAKNLPERAFHQYYPLDHPQWCERFIAHWKPDCALWIESEIWPNMLRAIKAQNIPCALINAKLSAKSFSRWSFFKGSAQRIISAFTLILTQTERDTERYRNLGVQNVKTTDNIKYSAKALDADDADLSDVKTTTNGRPVWVFASTHDGEEAMACRIHKRLKDALPNILTVIVPRHPERGGDIHALCTEYGLDAVLRGERKVLPDAETDIYIANTLGELGLFYRAAGIACIGRSFSNDGGGGHNPIEAAQLDCAVLYGPHVQYLQDIFDDMKASDAAIQCGDEQALSDQILTLLNDENTRQEYKDRAAAFAAQKNNALDSVMRELTPFLKEVAA